MNATKALPLLLAALLAGGAFARSIGFTRAALLHHGDALMLYGGDGHSFPAAKFPEQSGYAKPAVSPDGRHAGWLELQSDLSDASYAEPTVLVVEDVHHRTREFSGSFGMVFGWCFTTRPDAVTFAYSYPHGITPMDFDMRRIRDGKLLRHFELSPAQMDNVVGDAAPSNLPPWARCAWASVRAR
jgi:hypothetical protein